MVQIQTKMTTITISIANPGNYTFNICPPPEPLPVPEPSASVPEPPATPKYTSVKPPIRIIKTLNQAKQVDFLRSRVLRYSFEKIGCPNIKDYIKIVRDLMQLMERIEIIQNSSMKVSCGERSDKGYRYYPELGVSIKRANANLMVQEIIHLCNMTGAHVDIFITLRTGELIRIQKGIQYQW